MAARNRRLHRPVTGAVGNESADEKFLSDTFVGGLDGDSRVI
jgi:hypothetical protein